MTTPAARDNQSPLETALVDVHTTLADLLAAADEQYAAVVARDPERLESVTRQQERLSARLARAETRRLEVLAGKSLSEAVLMLPARQAAHAETIRELINSNVAELKKRQAATTSLLQRTIQLTGETLDFLVRVVTKPSPAYGDRRLVPARQSVLVDSRA